MTWIDLLYGALTIIVILISAWSRAQDKRLDDLESFQKSVYAHWEKDAREYVSKAELSSLLKEVKDALIRIENRLQNMKDTKGDQ